MKYKVGDKVRVRGDLKVGKRYGGVTFIPCMEKNKTFKILFARESENYILNDECNLCYSSEMLRPAEFKIWCETDEELKAVLEELEKEGYMWNDSRKKPTENINDIISCTCPIGFYLREDSLSYSVRKGGFDNQSMVELTPSEFTGIDFPKKIIITKTPTGATATYGDKMVETDGDFEDASRHALAEVLCPFKVGDKVKVTRNNFIGVVKKVDISNHVTIKCKNRVMIEFIGELEPYTEPYNAKLFCVKGSGTFEQGVVYAVENGVFTGVHGSHFKNLDDINKNLTAQFMEIKGGLDD